MSTRTEASTWPVRRGVHALDAQLLTVCPHTDDDGERETRVKEEYIKALDSDSEDDRRSSSKKIREGDKCEAEFKNTGKYYPGTVKRQHSDGSYEILFV